MYKDLQSRPLYAQGVIKMVNVVISHCCFAEDGTDLIISVCCKRSILIFSQSTNQILNWWHCHCCSRFYAKAAY